MSSQNRPKIVAVDGPAASGKSSVCAAAAQELGWTYVNTGFLYRAVGVLARMRAVDFNSENALTEVASDLASDLEWNPITREVWFRGQDLTPQLSSGQAGNDASLVAKSPGVRTALLPLQRRLALMTEHGAIIDGRDIGTVVFPDADIKVYLTASLEKRAERRFAQLRDKDPTVKLEDIKRDIARRDKQDGERGVAPLLQASDAVLLDTSDMTVEGSIQALVSIIRKNG